jgi:GTPase
MAPEDDPSRADRGGSHAVPRDAEPEAAASHCGFVAILGSPNVGKSTLVNRLVGAKVSIVSPKVQTTRARVLGIALVGSSQILLVDTPGLFQPRRRLDKAMVEAAWEGARGADEVVLVVDSTRGIDEGTGRAIEWLRQRRRRAVLVLNKVDAVAKPGLLALAQDLDATGAFSRTFMLSALTGDGVADFAEALAALVPPGPWLYPEDEVSDMPAWLLAAEITREKLFWQLQQELPYSIAVETESWTRGKDGSARIEQVIYVEREGQRGIVIGKGGQQLKRVGELARKEMQDAFDCRVHLFLFVKVREKWREDPIFFRLHGLGLPPPTSGR